MHAVAIPIIVSAVMVVSMVRDAVSSMRARARMDVLRRDWAGLPQLDGRTCEWWQRELDGSFRARFVYRRVRAAETPSVETADGAGDRGRPHDADPSTRRQMTTLMRQAWAFSVLVGTAAGWATHSYVRGLFVAGLMVLGTTVPAYVVRRVLSRSR